MTIDKGIKITSNTDTSIIFETLEVVDFTISGSSNDVPIPIIWSGSPKPAPSYISTW